MKATVSIQTVSVLTTILPLKGEILGEIIKVLIIIVFYVQYSSKYFIYKEKRKYRLTNNLISVESHIMYPIEQSFKDHNDHLVRDSLRINRGLKRQQSCKAKALQKMDNYN